MIALTTTLLFFLFLGILGIATMEAIRFRFGVLRGWLLAPITGLAVIMICAMVVSQAGIPARRFALPLTGVLLAASSAVIWWRRPLLPVRRLWPFWGILGFAAVYIGWQTIPYGFNWAAYSNGDALAYCHSASRLMDHGFFDVPKLAELLGYDYTQASWFQFAPGLYRCGFDLLLAWAASLTHMNPFAIYMPLMLCLGMVQVSGIAALVLSRSRRWKHALLAAVFLAMSPLFGFTVIAQVGPQVGGLALMLGLCALTLRSGGGGWRNAARTGLMVAILGVGLIVFYPEALPFLGVSYIGFHVALALARRANFGFQLRVAVIAAAAAIVIGRANLFRGYFSMVFAIQFSKATQVGETIAYSGFETFKMPHGPAVLFGLSDGQRLLDSPWLSMVIVAGFIMLILCLLRTVREAGRLQPYAFTSLALAVVSAVVFRSPNAFGLFKMALYLQPFAMAGVAAAVYRLPRRGIGAVVGAYLLISFVPHYYAVTAVTGALPGLSAAGVNLPQIAGGLLLKEDMPTFVPAALLQVYLKGVPQETLNSADSLGGQSRWVRFFVEPLIGKYNPYPLEVAESDRLADQVDQIYRWEECLGFRFQVLSRQFAGQPQLVTLGAAAYFNQLNGRREGKFFSYRPAASARNFLVFVNTLKGRDFYSFSTATSYYPFEKDVFHPEGRCYAIGRYFLFEVLNPAEAFRVRVSLSRTVVGEGRTTLPQSATVLAEHDAPLGLVGAGAANVFSGPVHSVSVGGHHYVAIDLGDEPIAPPNPKLGLMRLYNEKIPIDVRKLVAFGRDISAISEEDYASLERPRTVSKWPEDLFRGAGLEFSGFYEDGWVSNHAMLKLAASRTGEYLIIRGMIPGIGGLAMGNVLRVSIAGELAATASLRRGSFEIKLPMRKDLNVTSVNLDFALQHALPRGDDRPVSAQIQMIGLR